MPEPTKDKLTGEALVQAAQEDYARRLEAAEAQVARYREALAVIATRQHRGSEDAAAMRQIAREALSPKPGEES